VRPSSCGYLTYRCNDPRTNDAMNAPTNPAANPLGARFRIASLSASVFPSAAIHAFPKAGPYQIPPMTKLTIVATITAIKKFASNMTDMRSASSAPSTQARPLIVFPGPMRTHDDPFSQGLGPTQEMDWPAAPVRGGPPPSSSRVLAA